MESYIMFTLKVIDSGIAYEFYSRRSLIEPILLDASSYLKRLGFGSSVHEFQVVARELMTNAIEHGCRNSPTQKINLSIKKTKVQSLFEITVQDQGDGFEFDKLEFSPRADESRQSKNRGYALINELAENIQFDNGGSLVRVYIKMSDT